MCTDFINEIKHCFKLGGYIQSFPDGDEKGGLFLVGYKNRLFKINCDFDVAETLNGFDVCGSGESFALGVMSVLDKTNLTTNEKVLKSLEISEHFSSSVRGPFNLIST